MLLDPNSGFAIVSVSVAEAVDMPADDSCARDLYAFADLSDALVALKLGLLIGWPRERGEVVINPDDKSTPKSWRRTDQLIVLQRADTMP